ncbi:MAG: hypothetical protein KGZ63_08730 [Clostridiales bacterium]|jgi:hypothetical protein|nr:hypothetical protein [Clostridiales bacterium]
MSLFGSTLNVVLLVLTAVFSVFHFFSLRKEFALRRISGLLAVGPILLTIVVYCVIFKKAPMSPVFVYLLLAGVLVGLLFGAFTTVFVKENGVFGRRSRLYLFIWTVVLIATQGTVKMLGTASAGIGTAFMFFSLGMVIAQQFVLSTKAGTVKRKTIAVVSGVLFFMVVSVLPVTMGAQSNPFLAEKDGAHAYYLMAKDAFARGDFATAIEYGHRVVSSTRSPGTQAKGYMVIYLAGGGDQYGSLAHQGILNSGQLEGLSGEERDGAAVLIGFGIMEDIEEWVNHGYVIPPDENIMAVEGAFAIANSQLPGVWEEFKNNLGLEGMPVLSGIVGVLDALVKELAESSPVGEGSAAASAAAASAILVISGLLNIFANRPELLPQPVKQEAISGIEIPEGSSYVEGMTYTFHNGVEYKAENGRLVPVRTLGEGEAFIDPNGDKRVWVGNQAWIEKDWKEQQAVNEDYKEAHRADWEKASSELTPEMVDFFSKQKEALETAERLEALAGRIKAGRVNVGAGQDRIVDDLQKFVDATRSAGKIDKEKFEELQKTVGGGLGIGQEKHRAELVQAQTVAWRWNVATTSVEYVKSGADLAIDGLAKVTGPKGKAIQRLYKAASAIGGGVGEGYASGNWTEAMVEAGAQVIDNEIGDKLKTKSAKAVYTVTKKGVQSGYSAGKEAYNKGDDVLGATALGFLEGAADGASGVAKDSLSGGKKFVYTVGEGAVKGGYDALKKGGDLADVISGAGSGAVSGTVEATVETAFDHFIPESDVVDDEVMAQHQWKVLQERNMGEDPLKALNDVLPFDEWKEELLREEVRKVVKDGAKNTAKGEGLAVDIYKLGAEYFNISA